ncbi:ubiquinol-cytochrome-c reductase complex assembly factor 1 [Plakobranchus ocellatus]|uniref:Ubiquinol-cytochrome-c reductase complex assembly factor 1 n=1 Tax=Plakobranchus ocellatus TaxID=259542 RepID=A0AAV3ZCV3_9GAST|nr:ubiquinol-cytochrome-c reductase complex assembly factor 1 [Plakobranchus ocellatus]
MNLIRGTYSSVSILRKTAIQTVKAPQQRIYKHMLQQCACCTALMPVSPILKRYKHSPTVSMSLEELSTWQRMKWNMGFHGNLRVPNYKLKLSAYHLYICCTDFIDFPSFVKEAGIQDTFASWFQLLLLHLWLLNVKLSQIGLEGVLLKDHVYKAMWQNVEVRLDTFKDLLGSEKRKYMQTFYNSMILSTMYYDEGLIGSDKQLANALWISLYGMSKDVDPEKLELMVAYVRKQVYFHDQLDAETIMFPGYFPFLPLHGEKLDKRKADQDYKILVSSNS